MATTWMPSLRHDWGPPPEAYGFDAMLAEDYVPPVDGPVPDDTYVDDYSPSDEDDPRAPRVLFEGRSCASKFWGRCAVCQCEYQVGDDVLLRDDHPRVAHRICGATTTECPDPDRASQP